MSREQLPPTEHPSDPEESEQRINQTVNELLSEISSGRMTSFSGITENLKEKVNQQQLTEPEAIEVIVKLSKTINVGG